VVVQVRVIRIILAVHAVVAITLLIPRHPAVLVVIVMVIHKVIAAVGVIQLHARRLSTVMSVATKAMLIGFN